MYSRHLPISLILAALLAATPLQAQDAEGNPPTEFDRYWMVYLVRGDDLASANAGASHAGLRRHQPAG